MFVGAVQPILAMLYRWPSSNFCSSSLRHLGGTLLSFIPRRFVGKKGRSMRISWPSGNMSDRFLVSLFVVNRSDVPLSMEEAIVF